MGGGKMMDEKDREIWVGKNRLYLGEDNTLYISDVGKIDEKIAILCKNAAFKLSSMVEGKVNVFIDINQSGKQSSETRKVWKEFSEHEKFGKIALFGMHPVARVIASFVMGATKKKNMRFFKTKEEALAWLKE